MTTTALALGGIFLTTYLLSGVVLAYALRQNIIDTPNARSSHRIPTPRGGGLSFVAAIIASCLVLGLLGLLSRDLAVAAAAGGGAVAAIGWFDDKNGLPIRTRFLVQLATAIWIVYRLTSDATLNLGFAELNWSWAAPAFFVLAAAWLINLYNFMDGIDGLATCEAVTAGLAGGVITWGTDGDMLALATGCAALGFLPRNWPPAKIFMGDVGSGFLGLVFACLWIRGAELPGGFFIWPVLLGVFIVDATLTLLRRMLKKEKWYASHRSHAYQLAAAKWGHAKVTTAVIAINILWLTPCAVACILWPVWSPAITAVAYAPLTVLYCTIRRRFASRENQRKNMV